MRLRKKRKSGQIRMTETIAVLFIFFILILFGIIFYAKYQQVAFKDKQEELLAARAMDSTLKTLFLPELICSKGEAEPEDNCFDLMKLKYANETFTKHMDDYYFNIFSYARISIQETYPNSTNEWVIYDKEKVKVNENGTSVPNWDRREPTYFIVTIRDENNEQGQPEYRLGYLTVEAYS